MVRHVGGADVHLPAAAAMMVASSSTSSLATALSCAFALVGAAGAGGIAGLGCQGGSGSSSQGAASSGGGTGSAAGSTGTGTAGGTGTGGVPSFVDGGYVFCTAQEVGDAGSGLVSWMCPSGTYFCGSPESCSQCLSDADCANQALPTYDPKRARCDLDSGVRGYQGFCQRCLDNLDCAGVSPGVQCDLDPSSAVGSIDAFGFETCAVLGLGCPYGTQAGIGGCRSDTCATDQDCVGVLSPGQSSFLSSQQLEPYCVAGQCSAASNPDFCPSCYCSAASTCSGPVTSDAGEVCDLAGEHCVCTSSAQCGGFWPVCEISDGGAIDGGAPLDSCGCDRDDQCGDGGLKCLFLPRTARTNAGPACALPCDDPRFPPCAAVDPKTPTCDADSGLCVPCDGSAGGTGDAQCLAQADEGFEGPLCRLDGTCGCSTSADCRDGEICGGQAGSSSSGGIIGTCVPPAVPCTPLSNGFCNWDSGAPGPSCLSNFDCGLQSRLRDFCDVDSGQCIQCRDDSDCVAIGLAASQTLSFCFQQVCQRGCASDPDCVGNPGGPRCDIADGGTSGACSCRSASDCPAGGACHVFSEGAQCETGCTADTDCASGFFCDFNGTCRSRCDPGNGCHAPDLICDRSNVAGLNGLGYAGSVTGAVWCYPCLDPSQCGEGLGCGAFTGFACGVCGSDPDCPAGEICGTADSVCRPTCKAGACPAGQVCDTLGLAGDGVDVCYECLSPADCVGGQGCNPRTHTCGTCQGPTVDGGSYDCAPDAICSNYWLVKPAPGVCLSNCDRQPCPGGETCAVFPSLTPDHSYCFGCTQDSDCADAGAGARCDTSVNLTFTCQVPAG